MLRRRRFGEWGIHQAASASRRRPRRARRLRQRSRSISCTIMRECLGFRRGPHDHAPRRRQRAARVTQREPDATRAVVDPEHPHRQQYKPRTHRRQRRHRYTAALQGSRARSNPRTRCRARGERQRAAPLQTRREGCSGAAHLQTCAAAESPRAAHLLDQHVGRWNTGRHTR